MKRLSQLFLLLSLLICGCISPGYPYGYQAYQPYSPAVPPPQYVQTTPVPPPPQPGVVLEAQPYPYIYAPAPVLIAPTFFVGYGRGYWYANRFWPYRTGCAFYGGRYYGGYRTNYWRPGYGKWQGGPYHGGHGGNWYR
jgi:hypothetical protein